MRVSVVLGVVVAIGLSGCASGGINSGWPFPIEAAAPGAAGKPLRQMQIDVVALLRVELDRPNVTADSGQGELSELLAMADRSPRRREIRNSVVGQLVAASTANCNVYLQALRSGQVTARLGTDLASTAFGLAGSLALPAENARILSSLGAFSTASGASVDRNIFAQQGAELVADSIVQLREAGRLEIEGKLKRSYEQWPIGLALADVFEFHGDCSMLRGFSKMREAVIMREQLVTQARANALEVALRGGSGLEVAVAVAGRPLSPVAPPLTGSDAPLADLGLMRTLAMECLNEAQKIMDKDPTKKVGDALNEPDFAKDGKCSRGDDQWRKRLLGLALTALVVAAPDLDKVQADAAAAAPATEAQLKAATDKLEAANKVLHVAEKGTDQEAIARAKAEQTAAEAELSALKKKDTTAYTKRSELLKAAFGNLNAKTTSVIDLELNGIVAKREAALRFALALGQAGKTVEDVEKAIKDVGGANTEDPLFMGMYATVAGIKTGNPANGLMAAEQAQSYARTYNDTYR